MHTTDRGRRARLLALSLALLAVGVAGCGGSDDGDRDRDRADAVPEVMADLRWDIDDSLAESDPCGTWVVRSDLDERLQVVDVAADRVVLPEVAAPAGWDREVGDRWPMSGGCVPTDDGPVVVVETQAPFRDLADAPPKLVAGFDPAGEQLWVREVPGAYLGNYQGRGAVVLDELGPQTGGWLVLDAATGETVAEGSGEEREPLLAVSRDLAITISDGIVPLPDGPAPFPNGTAAQVDGELLVVDAGFAVQLVRLSDATALWRSEEVSVMSLWNETVDLSTGVVVLRGAAGEIVGLDLETGKRRWSSDVSSTDVNAVESSLGSGVLVVRDREDLDRQVLIDTATGQRLPDPDGTVVVGQEVLLLVDDEGVPSVVTVDDLR